MICSKFRYSVNYPPKEVVNAYLGLLATLQPKIATQNFPKTVNFETFILIKIKFL